MASRATLAIGAVAVAGLAALVIARGGSSPAGTAAPTTMDAAGPAALPAPTVPAPAPVAAPAAAQAAVAPTPTSAATPAGGAYAMDDLKLALADPSDDGTARLIDGLASDDVVVVGEAADGLVARRATGAIVALAAIDLDARPGVIPAVVDSLGKLGGAADGAARDAAVTRLLALLRSEKAKGAAAIPSTLLYVYEALGRTGDPRAVAPLTDELADARVGTAAKVVVVEALARLGATGSRDALAALRARLVGAPSPDAFEAELQRDLIAAIDQALGALR
ncbi:MAG: hypothetical protein JNK64_23845 [Myxococcales bacterium]|nr:hypothetical protein [Myxococcales bacterium]